MTNRHKIIWGVLAILLVGFIASRVFFTSGDDEVESVVVRKGDVIEYVSETGKVVAVEDLDLYFATTGRVSQVHVKEGEAVKEGAALMRLDAGQLFIRRQDAAAALAGVQAQYDKALAGATAEEIRITEIAVANAASALESARESLDDTIASNVIGLEKAYSDLGGSSENVYLKASTTMQTLMNDVFTATGDLRHDITSTDSLAATEATAAFRVALSAMVRLDADILSIRTASGGEAIDALAGAIIADGKAVRDAAAKANVLMQSAIPAGGLSQTTFDARVAAVKTVWTDISAAVNAADSQRALVSTTKISNLGTENTARQKVVSAEGALRTAEERLASLTAPLRDVDKAVYLAQIASARANVSLYDKQIADTVLKSPVAGIVGSLDVSVGELATPSFRAASVISKAFQIESDVSELDIAKIAIGQEVEVTFDALPGEIFMGKIVSVAPRETTAADLDIFYAVKVILDDMSAPLRSGMTADLAISIGERIDVIVVPRRQVLRRGGTSYVKVLMSDGTTEERDVVVGLRGDDDYEILDGVAVGERVLVE